jgi:2-amino-4-hydroxy-6-hydroxymethyldihydropteridine diphosphokinase
MYRYYLSLGSNLGDREKILSKAIEELKRSVEIKAESSMHESEPWGYKDQPDFLNTALEIETEMDPKSLLSLLKRIEKDLGRQKEKIRWGPRRIDIDIMMGFSNDKEIFFASEELTLPHARLKERKFYLVCLKELKASIKIDGKSIDHWIEKNRDQDVVKPS